MIVLRGKRIDTELLGFRSVCWEEDPRGCPRVPDKRTNARALRVRSLVFHTTSGTCRKVHPGVGTGPGSAMAYTRGQATTSRNASWDFTIGQDRTVYQQNDPGERYTWHASAFNRFSIGTELVETDRGVYAGQFEAAVALADVLTATFAIQRQIPWRDGRVLPGILPRADEHGADGGRSLVGVFAHFHNTQNRGPGDPGPFLFEALHAAGYEGFDVNARADLAAWEERQRALGFTGRDVDGLPLDRTCAALRAAGRPAGLWVPRPLDAALLAL